MNLSPSLYRVLLLLLGSAFLLILVGNYCCAVLGRPAPPSSNDLAHMILVGLVGLLVVPHGADTKEQHDGPT